MYFIVPCIMVGILFTQIESTMHMLTKIYEFIDKCGYNSNI